VIDGGAILVAAIVAMTVFIALEAKGII